MKLTFIEGNKLIHEFLGNKKLKWWLRPWFIKEEELLQYHYNWDVLMLVLNKIHHTSCIVEINWGLIFGCRICYLGKNKYAKVENFYGDTNEGLTQIEAVWFACVEFIKYYNSNINSVKSPDIGKCSSCRFNNGNGNCYVGTYYAEKGLNVICYEGELWKAKNNIN